MHRFRMELRTHTFKQLGPEPRGSSTIRGLAWFAAQAESIGVLLEAADKTLLQAKKVQKNRFWLIGGGDVQS